MQVIAGGVGVAADIGVVAHGIEDERGIEEWYGRRGGGTG